MDRANVDTDQIIPKQFLKRIERTGFGQFLFFDWRFRDDGSRQSRVRAEPARVRRGERSCWRGATSAAAPAASTPPGRWRTTASACSSPPASPTSSTTTASRTACCRSSSTRPTVDDLFARAAAHPGYQLTVDLESRTITDDFGLSLAVRGRRLPPPLPAARPGRHRPDARARSEDRRLRSSPRQGVTRQMKSLLSCIGGLLLIGLTAARRSRSPRSSARDSPAPVL